ncbi:membrane transporter [Moniliophthora roreri MCA 2997]|uniref:Membrane transporter n=2 Tax=Moniliophthora roreri TaxID=221103 RepID=V2WMD0_MONRO|nr:membrane transporter [Moniliophthora roreri MCA 2997]
MSSYFDEDDVEEQSLIGNENSEDGQTRLDKVFSTIGFGRYQKVLLALCGLGWLADNMWIQAIAIILPRVQQHYSVPDNYIGAVSSSMFAGMMFGAIGWGTCSDLMGRSVAFNATLFFTSLFGILAAFANSFTSLCAILFFLGSSVGGSMPTDGTLLLEHMPNGKQYLVTALSVFFSFGAVLSAVVALLVVPQHSCPTDSATTCDVSTQNQGWKYLLTALGLITLSMFLARMVFFRLYESPRYLVSAGRHQEALESLQMISRFNGSDLEIDLADVDDRRPATIPNNNIGPRKSSEDSALVSRPNADEMSRSNSAGSGSDSSRVANYSSMHESPTPLDAHSFITPPVSRMPSSSGDIEEAPKNSDSEVDHGTPTSPISPRPRPRPSLNRLSGVSSHRVSSIYERKVCSTLPRWLRRPLWAWWDRVMMVLAPEWLRTTVLVWVAWFGMSLAYTMFNVFLPKLLESSPNGTMVSSVDGNSRPKTLEESLWDVVIFTIGGCPGAILGAYMIESPLGRRWSLAGSSFITALFCLLFITVESPWAVRASSVGISLSATAMYAVLYGWTPEIFGTEVRGTACGIASALSRVGGMIAPILGGTLLVVSRSVPVYASLTVFVLSGLCVLMLKVEESSRGHRKGDRVVVH